MLQDSSTPIDIWVLINSIKYNWIWITGLWKVVPEPNSIFEYIPLILDRINIRAKIMSVCELAAAQGNLECLKYAHTHGYPWDKRTCINAILFGHIKCLQYACEHGCKYPCISDVHNQIGHVHLVTSTHCIQYMFDNYWNIHNNTADALIAMAVTYGQIKYVRYFYETLGLKCSQYMEIMICRCAVEYGHIKCLAYLYNKLNYTKPMSQFSIPSQSIGNFQTGTYTPYLNLNLNVSMCIVALKHKHYDCLLFLYNNMTREELLSSSAYFATLYAYVSTGLYPNPDMISIIVRQKCEQMRQDRINVFRQELIATALHPRRMLQWNDE